MTPRVITNSRPRLVLDWNQLTPEEQAEFGYMADPEAGEFVRYKNWVYDLGDMEQSAVKGWDMMVTDTFFSAVLFRYPREEWGALDTDHVVCGLYLC
jgi:hypothetical protein